ncbi:MAG: recombinase family protein [Thaumarchaeota archaeon]|nr:recombinase family protein [Nitrososphaerota archaeon]
MAQKYIIYCRKSTESEEKQVLSIEAQVKELKELSERLKISPSDVLTESRSAKYPGRPVFGRVMEQVSHGDVKGIICWKLDRLARNPLDGAAVVWALDQGKIEDIITPYNHLQNNSNDKFIMQLEFGMAKKYVDDLSDNVKRGNRMKLEKGWKPGLAPIGYLNDLRDHTIILDPARFPIVRKMWDLLLEGYAPKRIHHIASNELGLRRRTRSERVSKMMSLSSIYRIFTNPFYYGVIQYKGSLHQGKHQAMITEEEYWKAQELLGNKGKPRPKSHKFAFTGLMKCGECGCGITAEERVNRYGSHYTYYHCTKKKPDFKCSQEYIQEKDLEVQMLDYLDRIQVSKEFLDFALNYLEKEQAVSQEIESANEKSLEKALNDCERKLGNLNEMRLRELIDDEEYLKEKRKLTDEKAHLEVSIKKIKGGTGGAIASATRVFTFAYEAKERFLKSSLELKKSVIRELGSNFCLRDKNLSIDVEKPFKLIQEGYHVPIPKNARLEPQNNPVITRFLNPPQPQFLIWGALVNDVRTFFVDKLKNGEPPT